MSASSIGMICMSDINNVVCITNTKPRNEATNCSGCSQEMDVVLEDHNISNTPLEVKQIIFSIEDKTITKNYRRQISCYICLAHGRLVFR